MNIFGEAFLSVNILYEVIGAMGTHNVLDYLINRWWLEHMIQFKHFVRYRLLLWSVSIGD